MEQLSIICFTPQLLTDKVTSPNVSQQTYTLTTEIRCLAKEIKLNTKLTLVFSNFWARGRTDTCLHITHLSTSFNLYSFCFGAFNAL